MSQLLVHALALIILSGYMYVECSYTMHKLDGTLSINSCVFLSGMEHLQAGDDWN